MQDEIDRLKAEIARLVGSSEPFENFSQRREEMAKALTSWFTSIDAVRASTGDSPELNKLHEEARNDVYRLHKLIKKTWMKGVA